MWAMAIPEVAETATATCWEQHADYKIPGSKSKTTGHKNKGLLGPFLIMKKVFDEPRRK